MRLYFDACCISRLTDDQSQPRVLREAEAIEELIGFASSEPNVWVGSVVLGAELSRNPDSERRADAETILAFIHEFVKLDDRIVERTLYLRGKVSRNSTLSISHVPKARRLTCF